MLLAPQLLCGILVDCVVQVRSLKFKFSNTQPPTGLFVTCACVMIPVAFREKKVSHDSRLICIVPSDMPTLYCCRLLLACVVIAATGNMVHTYVVAAAAVRWMPIRKEKNNPTVNSHRRPLPGVRTAQQS